MARDTWFQSMFGLSHKTVVSGFSSRHGTHRTYRYTTPVAGPGRTPPHARAAGTTPRLPHGSQRVDAPAGHRLGATGLNDRLLSIDDECEMLECVMHGCCCLVTAPTELERTQDMHTATLPSRSCRALASPALNDPTGPCSAAALAHAAARTPRRARLPQPYAH